jgi:invasion protein IalB
MPTYLNRLLIAALIASLAGAMPGAQAQAPVHSGAPPAVVPASPVPAAAPRPDRTTAAYGDWVLRCELAAGGTGRSCEVAQTVLDGRGQVLAQLTGRLSGPAGAVALVVQVGTNATVAEPLRLGVETEAGLTLHFRRCLPRGCFAESQPALAEIAALLPRTEPARVEFRDGEGQPVTIPVSLRGLAASLDALRMAGP